jgi:hypothetical protein
MSDVYRLDDDTFVDEDGYEVEGVYVDEDGDVVDEDGNVLEPTGEEVLFEDDDDDCEVPVIPVEEVDDYVDAAVRATIEQYEYGPLDPYARVPYEDPAEQAQQEFDEEFVSFVEAVKRERGDETFSRDELVRMYEAADRADEDPRTKTDADVWQAAQKELERLDDNPGDYFDARLRDMHKAQEANEAEKAEDPEDVQTPAQVLADMDKAHDEYQEHLEAIRSGDFSRGPIEPEYQHPDE